MKFKRYQVTDSGKSVDEVFDWCNHQVFTGHGPDYSVRTSTGIVVNPLSEYERLIQFLATSPEIEVIPFCEADFSKPLDGKVCCLIRHDLDCDIVAALKMAEIENRFGAGASYYLLHTSPYYGEFRGKAFHRHSCMAHVYRRIQELGQEVALHTDGLHVYQEFGMDGAEAIEQELEWLRSEGIQIKGTTAHNSASVYGAENFALFKGRPRVASENPNACPREIIHDGKYARLQVLDERTLELTYEANEVFWQDHTPVRYAATRGAQSWRWVNNNGALKKQVDLDEGFICTDTLLDNIAQVEPNTYLVLVIHPVYFGLRHSTRSAPLLSGQSVTKSSLCGWPTYKPNATQVLEASKSVLKKENKSLSITWANELGMIDKPIRWKMRSDIRALLIGSDNINGLHIAEHLHCHSIAEQQFAEKTGKRLGIVKLAHPGVGLIRSFAWFKKFARRVKPNFVVLSVSSREMQNAELEFSADGWTETHLPGSRLDVVNDAPVVRNAGAFPAIMRRHPTSNADATSFEVEHCAKCLDFFVDQIVARGAVPVVMFEQQELQETFIDWCQAKTVQAVCVDTSHDSWTIHDHLLAGTTLAAALSSNQLTQSAA